MQLTSRTVVSAVCMTLLYFSCTCDGVPKGFFDMPPDRRVAEFEKYDWRTRDQQTEERFLNYKRTVEILSFRQERVSHLSGGGCDADAPPSGATIFITAIS